MALKIRTIGNPGLLGDIQPGWSISENATPHVIGDGSASVGGVQFSAARRDDSEFLLNKAITVYYEAEGTTTGVNNVTGYVDTADLGGAGVDVTSTNLLSTLTAERDVRPLFPLSNKLRTITGTNTGGSTTDLGYWPRYDATKQMVATIDRDYTFQTGAQAVIKYYDHTGTIVSKTQLTGGSISLSFAFPFEIDNLGRFYVSDQATKTISVFSATGAFLTSWSSPTTDDFGFTTIKYNPFDNNIWVVDNTSRVRAFTKSGTVVQNWKTYDEIFPASQGVGVRASDIAFTSAGVHAAQVSGVYAYTVSGSPLFSTPYEDIQYSNGNSTKALEIDRFGNYVVAIIGRLYVYGQRGPVLSKTGQLSGLTNTTASSNYGLAVTPDGHYMVGVEQVNNVATFQIFAGAPTTLRGYVYSVLNAILPNILNVVYSGTNPAVTYPGWTDSVWTKLNELCAATGKEIVLQNDGLIIRDLVASTVNIDDFEASPATSLDATNAARYVSVVNQNTSVVNNGVVFDYTDDAGRAISADIGETVTTTIETDVWLTSIQQPVFQNLAGGKYPSDGRFIAYTASGQAIDKNAYQQYGMELSVAINPDGRSIDVTLVGPYTQVGAFEGPYTIGSLVGTGTKTGISVIGSGVRINPQDVLLATGADWSKVTTEESQNIDNPFITTAAATYDRGMWAADALNGVAETISLRVPAWRVGGLGISPGATFTYRKARWRVLSSSFTNTVVTLNAMRYTTIGEHDALYVGQTIGQRDATLAALTLGDSALKPLY